MVFNATFNNISVILWQSVLLVEETRGVTFDEMGPYKRGGLTIFGGVVFRRGWPLMRWGLIRGVV
jgi:hypothetical protein